jgi:hypothetical protein
MELWRLHDYVLERLAQTRPKAVAEATGRLTIKDVAAGAGLPWKSVQKISTKEVPNPGVSHCEALAAFFEELERAPGETPREKFAALMQLRTTAEGGMASQSAGEVQIGS